MQLQRLTEVWENIMSVWLEVSENVVRDIGKQPAHTVVNLEQNYLMSIIFKIDSKFLFCKLKIF